MDLYDRIEKRMEELIKTGMTESEARKKAWEEYHKELSEE
jgi:hypothetical protein